MRRVACFAIELVANQKKNTPKCFSMQILVMKKKVRLKLKLHVIETFDFKTLNSLWYFRLNKLFSVGFWVKTTILNFFPSQFFPLFWILNWIYLFLWYSVFLLCFKLLVNWFLGSLIILYISNSNMFCLIYSLLNWKLLAIWQKCHNLAKLCGHW